MLNVGPGCRQDDGVPREEAMAGKYTICAGTIGSGLWLSGDGGESWRRVLPPKKKMDGGKSAVDPADPDTIFAGTRPAALFRSKDGGRSWQKLPATIAEECPNVRVPRVTALTVDPTDHNHVWAGIEVDGVLHSTDGGDSWRRITKGINDPDIHDMGVVVKGGASVLTTPPREFFGSHDRGESWTGLGVGDPFPLPSFRTLTQRADDPETLFVATGDGAVGTTGAIQRSTNGGK